MPQEKASAPGRRATPTLELAEFLERRPVGSTMWIRGLGRSMLPVLFEGDLLRVQRCEPEALVLGDIAVTRQAGQPLVAHLVSSLTPFETRGFLAANADTPGARVLGRVVAVKRKRMVVPFGSTARAALWRLYLVASAAKHLPMARTVFRVARRLFERVWPPTRR